MRPRHKAAENPAVDAGRDLVRGASMRPRHKAAENPAGRGSVRDCASSFNEAAA